VNDWQRGPRCTKDSGGGEQAAEAKAAAGRRNHTDAEAEQLNQKSYIVAINWLFPRVTIEASSARHLDQMLTSESMSVALA
jgi:hypothetical protein